MTKEQEIAWGIAERAAALIAGGRPRMRPGKPRPRATTAGGTIVNPRNGAARKFSLQGAIERAAYLEAKHHPKATVSRAKHRVIDELLSTPPYNGWTIGLLDHALYDGREIERALRRVSRNIQKGKVIA